jgi:GAF domain
LTQQLTSSPRKTLLDEASFQDLLAAAFVLQQHNEIANNPSASSTEVLSEVVRIQRLIRGKQLNLVDTAKLISQQVQRFTRADGVAIGIVTGDEFIYLAAVGSASHDIGRRLPQNSSLAAHCIRSGVVFQSPHTQDDPRMLFSLGDHQDVRSFIAVPVAYDNKVVGVLEARFRVSNAFRNDDVNTCELMAGLVKEVIVKAGQPEAAQEVELDAEPLKTSFKKSISIRKTNAPLPNPPEEKQQVPHEEPASALQFSSPPQIPPAEVKEIGIAPVIESAAEPVMADDGLCRGCGQHLAEDELFCGKCGTERLIKPDGPLQSKWASLWYMNQARRRIAEKQQEAQEVPSVSSEQNLLEAELAEIEELREAVLYKPPSSALTVDTALPFEDAATESDTPSVRLEWLPNTPATASESWLRRQWRVNRANFYLAGAALLLIGVLFGRGATPALDSAANPSAPQLTLFERALVGLGIAEAPQAPVSNGNPDTPVWVDLHTALYYCPGSDLYGKTDGGKIATQRSAQMDQFEPAHRKACN